MIWNTRAGPENSLEMPENLYFWADTNLWVKVSFEKRGISAIHSKMRYLGKIQTHS
jgi:hypothetical protein